MGDFENVYKIKLNAKQLGHKHKSFRIVIFKNDVESHIDQLYSSSAQICIYFPKLPEPLGRGFLLSIDLINTFYEQLFFPGELDTDNYRIAQNA